MYNTRKSSGSASFLNRLQRNAQFASGDASASAAPPAEETVEESGPEVTPETVIQMLAEMREAAIGVLAERIGAPPEALAGPVEQLRANDCVRASGDPGNPDTVVTITDVGMKTASFTRIARA